MSYPSKKTPEVIDEILRRLSDGEPLAVICRSDEKFPHPVVWGRWVDADPELAIAYARARDVGADAIATQALTLADGVAVHGESIQKAKLQIETRLKLLAKWNPKKYGDKSAVDIGNKEGEKLQVESTVAPDQLAALAAALITKPEGK